MNAEALIGTRLGTCILQKIIGQGGMGAVYLAQQSRPRRQVAVKVLLPAANLSPQQHAAFLERFRRETDAAASLEHPNIVPVYEYGERDGLAYLVMPYISGGTLRDLMETEGQFALPEVAHYLDQLAAALDFAHERGVIHRDIKPANILITPEGRLLLTDFGLVKLLADGQPAQRRLTGAGAPVGTPDYMSPEQVIGDIVDGRADMYSLGIILYQMVTGLTPFQGETPMQIAAQQLHAAPPSPRILRPELPPSTEQVMLRVLAKRPIDRYATCQEFASAFRFSLAAAGMLPGFVAGGMLPASASTAMRSYAPHGLFDPAWQTGTTAWLPAASFQGGGKSTRILPAAALNAANNDSIRQGGLLSRAGMIPKAGRAEQAPAGSQDDESLARIPADQWPITTQPLMFSSPIDQLSPALKPTTGALAVPNSNQAGANTVKLTGPLKVVQVPVAGQPGQYITGLLPMMPQTPSQGQDESLTIAEHRSKQPWKFLFVVLALLLIFGTGASFWYVRTHQNTATRTSTPGSYTSGTPDVMATATARALATAQAYLILKDPLTQNINNWPTSANEFFQNGAYHIYNTGNNAVAVVLAGQSFNMPNVYTLTMWEVRGNDSSNNNSFGMIFRFSQQARNGKVFTTFYSFEVVNIPGGEYRLYKYDDSQGSPAKDWTELWHQSFGSEFHQGQGKANTISIASNGPSFRFTVNGKVVGTAHDSSLKTGTIGMLVNLKGTEVAFSNLLITRD